ncbi:efflux transporter outer membrane subunit [uncultured Sphingomonas sp.]|uniref:efflux transporter outer membrane subunit n=1 Tax=uncultured Sphingomonas sp. TaxID=158754 RepID=UPI00262418DA|nr:efflux transporter outer membrane subunit [uncultured Sphingomonas sp.]
MTSPSPWGLLKRFAPLLLLAGCTVGPNFERPKIDSPSAYGAEPTNVPSRTYGGEVDTAWWTNFRDPELSSLVDRLAKQNLDLQSAAERIAQSRAQRDVAASQGLPHIDATPKYTRERESLNGTPSLVTPAPGAPLAFNLFQPMVSAGWELDLFGRVRRAVEAAGAQTQAAIEARRGIALSAIAELAQDYMQLRQLQREEAFVRDNLALSQKRIALVRNRFANGVATTLDLAQAEAQASTIAQDLPTLRSQQAQMINAIGLLLAEPPRSLLDELTRPAVQPPVPPIVPVGLPGELMRRRPDIREAEADLHAATAETGVAVASFYPDISLSGSFGFESLKTSTLFDWASRVFMVGPTVDLPIFEGGRLKGTLKLRKAQQREAAIQYRKVVLQAWHDVDNALTAYAEAQHAQADTLTTTQADARALRAAEQQYAEGVTTFIDVIQAQTALLQSQDAGARANARVEIALVSLYKALGGGWETVAQ